MALAQRHGDFDMKSSQLVFSNSPIDWTIPLEFGFGQLASVAAAADKAGFYILRLKVTPKGYQAQCARLPSAGPGDPADAASGQPGAARNASWRQGRPYPPPHDKDSF
jgi:hypothetical protein